jgi:type I restriction enzyme S subunit
MGTEVSQEVPEGFEPTELGPLPLEWDCLSFEASIARRQVRVGKVDKQHYRAVGKLPIIDQGQEFIAGYWDRNEDAYHGDLPIIIFGDHTRIFKYVDFPFVCGADGTKVLLPDTSKFDPRFMFFALLRLEIPSRGYNRHYRLLREQRIPHPPLDEQRAIARVLAAIQRAIEATDRVIAAARQLKRSLMRHLFTYGPVPIAEAERVPLKETEIGLVPEHWDVVPLGAVATIGNGSTPKRSNPAYWEGGTIPWLTSAKVHEVVIKHADQFVTELALAECHLPTVRKGSVVVAITGQGKTLGNAALVTFDTTISQHLACVQFDSSRLCPEYVLAHLQRQYADLRSVSQAGGSTKGALTCGFLKGYPMPLPPLQEQQLAANALAAVGRKIDAEQKRRAALKELFRTMLHLLMTGQVRVKDLELGNGPAT